MPRPDRSRPTARFRPNASLERLEERQLLSTVPIATLSALPAMQPDAVALSYVYPSAVYTPSQVRTAYGVNQIPDEGQGMTVAIVDAYSQPNIQSDVNTFSSLFGLPKMDGVGGDPTLSIYVPTGQSTPPPANTEPGNWGREISLDVEWVHSIAPYANIDLVTCQNSSPDSLWAAEADGLSYASGVGYAKSLPGVVVVSNSYGGPEFSGETFYDPQFTTPSNNVAFVFSTGDTGAPGEYPAYSPNVVAVGGTSLATKSINGQYGSEIGWSLGSDTACCNSPTSASGGGVSLYEPTPSYQYNNGVNYGKRSEPDVSWLADPNTGVWIVDTLDIGGSGLGEEGGTSLATPMWAGLIALGDQARGSAGSLSSTGVLDSLYGAYNSPSYSTYFHDITSGYNGNGQFAGLGYDLVTGIGTPKAQAIFNLLGAAAPAAAPAVSIGSQTVNTGQSAGLSTVSYNSGKSVSVYSKPLSPISINNVFTDVALSDFVTTVDIPKVKKIGSLLFS
jgi:subtilase family serine protease